MSGLNRVATSAGMQTVWRTLARPARMKARPAACRFEGPEFGHFDEQGEGDPRRVPDESSRKHSEPSHAGFPLDMRSR
jgi:hypothetical protein